MSVVAVGVYAWLLRDLVQAPQDAEGQGSRFPPRDEVTIELPSAPAPRTAEQLRAEAERVASELMERYPQSPGALHIAATHYAELQQYAKATKIWEACLRRAPQYAGPWVGLANAAMEQGDDARAIKILEDAIEAGCRTAEVFRQLAAARQKTGELDAAKAAARKALTLFPRDAELWLARGQIHLQQQQWEEAEASLSEALRLDPDSTEAHFALATAAARLGKPESAAEHRRRFTELKARHPLERHRFQVVYDAVLRRIVVVTLCDAAAEHQRQGDSREAERLYLEALRLNPRHADAHRWLASLYHAENRLGDAHLVQQRLLELEPEREENYLNLASLAAQRGRREEAEAVLLALSRRAPNSAAAHVGLAKLYLQHGQLDAARAHAEQAARREPSVDAYLVWAAACQRQGDETGAQGALRAARDLAPNDPRVPRAAL